MISETFLKIYAEKFLEYLKKNNIDFKVSLKEKIEKLVEIFENQKERQKNDLISRYLKSQSVEFSKKIDLIKEICDQEQFLNFLKVVNKTGDFLELDKIFRSILKIYNRSQKIVEANLDSVVEFDDTQIKQIKKMILNETGLKAKITNRIKKNIIGGFVVRFDDLVLDMSVKGLLEKIQTKFFG